MSLNYLFIKIIFLINYLNDIDRKLLFKLLTPFKLVNNIFFDFTCEILIFC